MKAATPALLALADGAVFRGCAAGAAGQSVGEVVFNTAMTGYQEILSDPSYTGQLVTLTYPHIGNTGVNAEDLESHTVRAAGLIVRDVPPVYSSWRATTGLPDDLAAQGVVAIAGIDTRKLTRRLRKDGACNGCIVAGAAAGGDEAAADAVAAARAAPAMQGADLARTVTTDKPYTWHGGPWHFADDRVSSAAPPAARLRVVACDFGIKHNILRLLAGHGCEVTVVPATTDAAAILALRPHGVFLSNGPGDPEPCGYAVTAVRALLERRLPLFGICLGHQLLALACGARTMKMACGHHGANHPVQELASGKVLITSQNHGFCVAEKPLPKILRVTHRSLFDGTIQGLEHTALPAFSFQGHPEASPGPHDLRGLFERFVRLMEQAASNGAPAPGASGASTGPR